MQEIRARDWKIQIRFEKFPERELPENFQRKTKTVCPRCHIPLKIAFGISYGGHCPGCGLYFQVEFIGGEEMGGIESDQAREVEARNRLEMIASFRQVTAHYVTKRAGLESTAKSIEQEQEEVASRARELQGAAREVSGHLHQVNGVIDILQAATDKLVAEKGEME